MLKLTVIIEGNAFKFVSYPTAWGPNPMLLHPMTLHMPQNADGTIALDDADAWSEVPDVNADVVTQAAYRALAGLHNDAHLKTYFAIREDERSKAKADQIASLQSYFRGWLEGQGLPQQSADELLVTPGITHAQAAWLRNFIADWDGAQR
jgi:hypothetical protein